MRATCQRGKPQLGDGGAVAGRALRRVRGLLTLVLAAGLASSVGGQVVSSTWLGGSGNWTSNANWSLGEFPNNNAGSNFVVFIDGNNPLGSVVTQNVNATIDALHLDAGDFLRITNTFTLTVSMGPGGGVISNRGSIWINSAGFPTQLRVADGTVTLSGGGTILMGNHSGNRILGMATTNVLVNLDNTIEGAGEIGYNSMGLDNRATITANLPTKLIVNPSAAGVINSGTLQANAAILQLFGGVFSNFGGVIRAVGGAGLVMAEATAVAADGGISPADMGIWSGAHVAPLARCARFIEQQGGGRGDSIGPRGTQGQCGSSLGR